MQCIRIFLLKALKFHLVNLHDVYSPFVLYFSYGDILPTLSAEKWVSVISMLWGVVLFGYILGGLASTLTTSDAQRARYIHRLHVIKDHLVRLMEHAYMYTHTHIHDM